MKHTKEKLIILDRDGVINYESDNYIKNPDEWIPIPRSLEAIACLNKLGYRVVVATNQSGVERGYYSVNMLEKIHQKMCCELAKVDGCIDKIYFCPHRPESKCSCRKPKPGMLYLIAKDFPYLFNKEVPFVGDSVCDIEAARAAGCRPILLKTGHGKETMNQAEEWWGVSVFENLWDYVCHLKASS